MLLLVFLIPFLLGLVAFIITIVAGWKAYAKMGEPGWYSIVPIWSLMVLTQRLYGEKWIGLLTLVPVAGPIFMVFLLFEMFKVFGLEDIPAALIAIFIPPIGWMIVGFSDMIWDDGVVKDRTYDVAGLFSSKK